MNGVGFNGLSRENYINSLVTVWKEDANMNLKLSDVFWILMNKVDTIVIYMDEIVDNPHPEYQVITKDTDINSIIDYMTMNVRYMGRDQNYDGSLIYRVVLSEKEI